MKNSLDTFTKIWYNRFMVKKDLQFSCSMVLRTVFSAVVAGNTEAITEGKTMNFFDFILECVQTIPAPLAARFVDGTEEEVLNPKSFKFGNCFDDECTVVGIEAMDDDFGINISFGSASFPYQIISTITKETGRVCIWMVAGKNQSIAVRIAGHVLPSVGRYIFESTLKNKELADYFYWKFSQTKDNCISVLDLEYSR